MDQKHNDDSGIEDLDPELEKLAAALMVSRISQTCRERRAAIWTIPQTEIVEIKAQARLEAKRRLKKQAYEDMPTPKGVS